MTVDWEASAVLLAVLGAIGASAAWIVDRFEKAEVRRSERARTQAEDLRLDEVSAWAKESIATMQSLVVALRLDERAVSNVARRAKVLDAAFQTSVLIETGRLYFKNQIVDDFGAGKEPAYRGYRPLILDQLVIACQVADRYLIDGSDEGCRLLAVAEDATRKLVSLLQAEVGRSRSASIDTGAHGDGANLEYLLSVLPKERQERLCPSPSSIPAPPAI